MSTTLVDSLASIAEVYEHRLMTNAEAQGYSGLKMSFRQVIPYLGIDGARISELAERHGVSKQAMGQLINDIEKEGFVSRQPDPNDKRALKIVLSEAGVQLVNSAINNMQNVDEEFASCLGKSEYSQLRKLGAQLFRHYQLSNVLSAPVETHITRSTPGSVILSELNQHFQKQLTVQLQQQGLKELKRQHQGVLQTLTSAPARIIELAEIAGTSKQAAQQMVNQMIKLGWVEKQLDPNDSRAVNISLAKNGRLIIEQLDAIKQQLEQQAAGILGKDWPEFRQLLNMLHDRLQGTATHSLEQAVLRLCREHEKADPAKPYSLSPELLARLKNASLPAGQ